MDQLLRHFIYAAAADALSHMVSHRPLARRRTLRSLDHLAMWVCCAAGDGLFDLAQLGGNAYRQLSSMVLFKKNWWQDEIPRPT